MKTSLALGACIGCLLVVGVGSCSNSEWWEAKGRANAAATVARETPHVIRQADGCKVYAFETGSTTHYFTRCGDTVTTDRSFTEQCGKGCSRNVIETVVTKGNQ